MSQNIPRKDHFQQAFEGKAPWDIGKPQSVFVEAADQITGSVLDNLMPSVLWRFAGMPGFFSGALIASLFGASLHESGWLAILITAAQIAIGLWLIRVGPKPVPVC